MKRLRNGMLALLLAAALCAGTPAAAQGGALVEAETEQDAAYILIQNLQAKIPARRVRVPAGLDMGKVFGYVDAVVPAKVQLAGLQIQTGTHAVCDYYVQLRDPDEAAADSRARELAAELAGPEMTNAEKIKVFHDYLVKHCEPDLEAQAAVKRGEADAVDRYIASFCASGALLHGRAVCDGYSAAMMLLCHYAGVTCFRVSSVAMNHAWNYVYDGESWRYVDVIFDDSAGNSDYLMGPEDVFFKTHQFDDGSGGTVSQAEYLDFFDYYFQRSAADAADGRDGVPDVDEIAARMLNRIGMLQGTEGGFELGRVPTRNEMAVMLVRILGKEGEALQGGYTSPFDDVGWAENYVGYLYQNGLVAGISETRFGGDMDASSNDYATLLLRTLGYSDAEGDFRWDTAAQACAQLGIAPKGAELPASFTRGDMAQMTLHALMAGRKTDGVRLLDHLTADMPHARPLVQDVIAEYGQLSCWN